MDVAEINESWFDEQAQAESLDRDLCHTVLSTLADAGRVSDALKGGQQLLEHYTEQGRFDDAICVLSWLAEHSGSQEDVVGHLKKIFGRDKNAMKLIEPAGFSSSKPLADCFQRLVYLRSLKEGALCYHTTWGFGVIEEIDYFYAELEINFEKKGDHTLAFSYAAESLELLDDDHILTLRQRDPDGLKEKIKKQPGEIIRLALQSYGNMSVALLIERLVPSIVPESDWKRFWDGARKALKDDASIEIPRKRSELIELRDGMAYDDIWFEKLAEERDITKLFERFKEVLERGLDITSQTAQQVLSERLAFVIGGAPTAKPEWKAEGFIYARLLNVQPTGLDVDAILHALIESDLGGMLDQLPSRQLETLLAILFENDKEALVLRLKRVLPKVSHPVFNEIMAAFCRHGVEEVAKEIMVTALGRRKASAPMLLWCQRAEKQVREWNLISKSDLAFRIQEVLEKELSGALLRAQNQLREKFQQQEWLHDVMDEMSEQQRRDFMRRINEGQGWEVLDRKSVLAKVLRKYPELQDIVTPAGATVPKKEVPLTSSRSYRERQAQLEKLMKVDIPENSKEIEIARSYGDLRENAEFKYAKERQGLLMAQGAQLAEDLEKVKPSDFEDIPATVVSIGTGVQLQQADGSEIIYFILGAWDQDDELHILSSETRLAQALLGHKSGDRVEVPDGQVVLKDVLPLSADVKAWIRA